MKKLFSLFVAALLLFSACASLSTSSDESALLHTDSRVVSGMLDNGLSWMVMENHEPENRIILRLVVRAGSVLEDEDQKGIAHLVEHMAFKGTRSFGKEDLVDYFETIGMAFGPEVNAYTSFDETVYKLEIPADDPAILDRSLAILREWADSLTFAPEELEKERAIVIEEWRVGRGASQRVRDRQVPVLFRGTPYADRLPIGDPEIIRTLSRERIIDFYRDWYRPELMTVIAVGDADASLLEKKVRAVFAGIPASKNPRPRPEPKTPPVPDPEVLVVRDPELTYTTTQILQTQDVLSLRTTADYRQRLVESIAFSAFNSRLQEKTVVSDPLFLAAESGAWRLVPALRFSWLWMAPSPGKYEQAFESLFVELERLKRYGITPGELEREKTARLEQVRKSWQDRESVSSTEHGDSLVWSVLFDEPYLSLDTRFELSQQLLPGITADEVFTTVRSLFPGKGTLLLVTASDEARDVPGEDTIRRLWNTVTDNREITAYEDTVSTRTLFPGELAEKRGSVVARHELSEDGIVQLDLSNGATVIIHPTDFRENEVLFSAFSKGGSSLVSEKEYPSAAAAVDYVSFSGLNEFDPVALKRELSSYSVSVYPWIRESHEGLSGNSTKEDLEILFQLINLHITRPGFTPSGWSSLMTQLRTHAENRRARPEEQFNDMLKDMLYGDTVRFANLDLSMVASMDPSVAERIYRERFAGADDFVFVFTGSIDEDTVVALAEQYIATLPVFGVREDARPVRPPFPQGIVRRSLESGLAPKSMVFIGFGGEEPLRDMDYELFGQFRSLLDLRLREAIRETLGGSYDVWIAGSRTGYPDERFVLQIQFGCEPGREAELTRAVIAELTSLRENPVTEKDLVKLREQYRRTLESGLQSNNFWHSRLVQVLMRGEAVSLITDTEAVLSRLTAGTLQEQARRYIDPENYVSGWLLPAETQALREAEGQPVPAAQ